MEQKQASAFRLDSSAVDPLEQEHHRDVVERVSRRVTFATSAFVVLAAGSVLVGWALADSALIHFPADRGWGTMMPMTAACALLLAGALWLLRSERDVSPARRLIAWLLAGITALTGVLFLSEYVLGLHWGIDLLLFREEATSLLARTPGRLSIASATSLVLLAVSILILDAKSTRIKYASDITLLLVCLIGVERLVGALFGEQGVYAPRWQMFGVPMLYPMSPKAACCIIALAIGILFARPERGVIGLFLAAGPGGFLARWLAPFAIVVPIAFGWIGLLSIRAGLRDTDYPLSLVVCAMIVLLLTVISLSARAIQQLDLERVTTSAALAERERIVRTVLDNAGAGIFLIDMKGIVITINTTLQKMLGYTQEEMSQLTIDQITHPEDVPTSYRYINEMIRGERDSYTMEKRYIRKDGSQFWGEVSTSVARDRAGLPEFVVGIIQDITNRKEAEDAQHRLTAILDATPDFVGITDLHGSAIYLNPAGRKLSGVDDEDISRLSIPDFHPPAVAKRIMTEAVPSAIQSGMWRGESELLSPQGARIPVSQVILSHKKTNGNIAYLSTIIRDISDQKQLENAQHFLIEASRALSGSLEMEAILRSLVALVVPAHADYCGICLLNSDGYIEKAAIARMQPETHQVREQLHVYPGRKKPNPIIEEVARSAQAMTIPVVTEDWLIRLMRGTRHPALRRKLSPRSFMAVPLPGRRRVHGVICYTVLHNGRHFSSHDLALAREMAASVSLALDNADLLNQSREATSFRDEVLRIVAHDLRSPLNAISLSAGYLRQQWAEAHPDVDVDKLGIIERSVTQADHLIQDLLDVARMEAGQMVVEAEPIDMHTVVAEAIELQQPQASQRSIQIRSGITDESVMLKADRRRVLQVFSNLVGNALKFSPRGSRVTLCADREDDVVRFSVKDEGPGIEKTDFSHLFDPFWQARRGLGGAGLGLSISRAIVQAHGGSIWVESEPGAGSTFFFTLPVAGPLSTYQSIAAD